MPGPDTRTDPSRIVSVSSCRFGFQAVWKRVPGHPDSVAPRPDLPARVGPVDDRHLDGAGLDRDRRAVAINRLDAGLGPRRQSHLRAVREPQRQRRLAGCRERFADDAGSLAGLERERARREPNEEDRRSDRQRAGQPGRQVAGPTAGGAGLVHALVDVGQVRHDPGQVLPALRLGAHGACHIPHQAAEVVVDVVAHGVSHRALRSSRVAQRRVGVRGGDEALLGPGQPPLDGRQRHLAGRGDLGQLHLRDEPQRERQPLVRWERRQDRVRRANSLLRLSLRAEDRHLGDVLGGQERDPAPAPAAADLPPRREHRQRRDPAAQGRRILQLGRAPRTRRRRRPGSRPPSHRRSPARPSPSARPSVP